MPLTQTQFTQSLAVLFDPTTDGKNTAQLAESAAAYQNLALHFIEKHSKHLMQVVRFDPVKMELMLGRFYRDAYSVGRFDAFVEEAVESGEISEDVAEVVREKIRGLSIRINSPSPRRNRIAAAFVLWATTMRPLCLTAMPQIRDGRLWRLEATIIFWITTSYLEQFGEIQIGVVGDMEDFETRLHRVWYDFTFRDLNLSSLEMMYSSIFRPTRQAPQDVDAAVARTTINLRSLPVSSPPVSNAEQAPECHGQ